MVGWLFSIGTLFESLGNAARIPGVLLGHCTFLIWNRILSPYLDEKRQAWWLAFVLLSPLLGLGSLIITPDVPMVFFWSLSLLVLLRLLEKPKPSLYAALGVTLGLGFCSKYLIVIFVPTALAWLVVSGEWKKLKFQYIPLTIVTGLLACFPVLYWNYTHEWASFAFQLDHGLVSEKRNPMWPVEYLAGQLGLIFPIVAWLALQRREPREARFLHWFAWAPIAFFLYTSIKARVEANWPIMAYPAILSLAMINAKSLKPIVATMIVWGTALLIVVSQVVHPWLPIDENKLKTSEFHRFDVFAEEAAKNDKLYLGSYQMAAAVSYKLRRQFYKIGGMNRRDFYDFTPQSMPTHDRFSVAKEKTHSLPAWITEQGYTAISSRDVGSEFEIVEVERRAKDSDR